MLTPFVIYISFITCFQTRETGIFIFKYRLRVHMLTTFCLKKQEIGNKITHTRYKFQSNTTISLYNYI